MQPAAKETAFGRVARDLREQVLAGAFAAEQPLPTEAEIAAQHAVSRQTVRRAFQDLVAEGLVTRVAGRGTFATPQDRRYLRQLGSVEDLMALSADSQLRVLEPLASVVDPAAAGRLRLPDDRVATAGFVRLDDGRPFSHTRVFLPSAVARRLDGAQELSREGLVSEVTVIGLLDRVLPDPIAEAEQSITVAAADAHVAAALELAPGTPVLRIDRTYYDRTETPVELAVSHYHPERYTYRVRLRRAVR